MVKVPFWLTLAVALAVASWGGYRIALAMRSKAAQHAAQTRGGLFGQSRRRHALLGTIYLLLAAMLVASSLGWSPLTPWFPATPGEGSAPPVKSSK
ncbi:MAG: hypothetical protein IPL79_04460 [Myxococcales bacterium]|nr:hypothetical protein [Myxococcales bacterium]